MIGLFKAELHLYLNVSQLCVQDDFKMLKHLIFEMYSIVRVNKEPKHKHVFYLCSCITVQHQNGRSKTHTKKTNHSDHCSFLQKCNTQERKGVRWGTLSDWYCYKWLLEISIWGQSIFIWMRINDWNEASALWGLRLSHTHWFQSWEKPEFITPSRQVKTFSDLFDFV